MGLTSMGRQVMRMNWTNEIGCDDDDDGGGGPCRDKGPLPREKSNSLELPSHVMRNEMVTPRLMEESLRGRYKKRDTAGSVKMRLLVPFGTL